MQLRRLAVLPVVTLCALGISLVLAVARAVRVQAQVCGSAYLNSLPVPTPTPPAHRVIQLVNCSNQVLLGATNAASSGSNHAYPGFSARENVGNATLRRAEQRQRPHHRRTAAMGKYRADPQPWSEFLGADRLPLRYRVEPGPVRNRRLR